MCFENPSFIAHDQTTGISSIHVTNITIIIIIAIILNDNVEHADNGDGDK